MRLPMRISAATYSRVEADNELQLKKEKKTKEYITLEHSE